MKDNDYFSKFIINGDFTDEKITDLKEYYEISDKQLVKKYLNI